MGAIMVNGTLTVCSGIASTTFWFNNHDCRCRCWIRRVERAARGNLENFKLLDGSRYYFDPTTPSVFLHMFECLRA